MNSVRMNKHDTLRLYKNILYCAKRFPSIKRNKIVEEIRLGFRQNRGVTDEAELKKLFAVAYDGLDKLSMYTSLPKGELAWSVSMERQPMPNNK